MAQAIKLETEAVYYFKIARTYADVLRSGDATALFEARDDMEMIEMHARHPQIKARATRALATL